MEELRKGRRWVWRRTTSPRHHNTSQELQISHEGISFNFKAEAAMLIGDATP